MPLPPVEVSDDDDLIIGLDNPESTLVVETITDLNLILESAEPSITATAPSETLEIEIPVPGPPGPPGPPGTGANALQILVEFLAAQDIAAYDPVTSIGTIGDSDNLATRGKVIGIAIDDVPNGALGLAVVEGEIVNPLWSWSPGTRIYLNSTTLSAAPPSTGYSQRIAVAETDMSIIVQPQPVILL